MFTQLAIVLPAYKATFLSETLKSIAAQTNKNFHVYIGDDASPYNLKSIVNRFKGQFEFTYTSFNSNMGGSSLTAQWERCIALSNNEPFIWLFSDDDIMPHDAVERFYTQIENNRSDVYRFELELINSKGNPITRNVNTPVLESGFDFIKRRLKREVHSAITEFIFTRKVYENNGFVEFPLAWNSDTATMAKFTNNKGIRLISGNPVSWRTGDGHNISSSKKFNKPKLNAHIQFVQWVYNRFNDELKTDQFRKQIIRYLRLTCGNMLKGDVNMKGYCAILKLLKANMNRVDAYRGVFSILWYVKVYRPYRNVRRFFVAQIRQIKS